MLNDREKATYGRSLAIALRVLGPTPRADALGMLRGLRLSDQDAAAVLAHAIEHGILDVLGADFTVGSTPTERRRAPRRAFVAEGSEPPAEALDALALLTARVHRALAEAHEEHSRAVRLVDVLHYECLQSMVLLDPPANDVRPRTSWQPPW